MIETQADIAKAVTMRELISAHDWQSTSLGSLPSWQPDLRIAVDLILNSPLAMAVLWGRDLIQIYNDSYRSVMGDKHPAGLGQPVRDCWPESWAFSAPIYEGVFHGETRTFKDQKLRFDRNGHRENACFDLTYGPIMEKGEVGGVLVTAVETTGRRSAELQQQQSEGRFRLIVENARDHAIFTTDVQGLVTDWHGGAKEIFGYEAKEILGRDSAILFTPEDRKGEAPREELEDAARDGRAPDVRWHLRKDGSRVFIEGSVSALRGPGGELQGFLKIGQDVTARRQAERELQQSRRDMQALIEGIPQLVWRADSAGDWLWASPQWTRFTGLSNEVSRGGGWLQAVHPDDQETARTAWRRAMEKRSFSAEYRLCEAHSGRFRWFSTRAMPTFLEDGQIGEWFGTSTDIDDLRKLEQNQRIMLGELQHRVRNTLAVIRSIVRRTAETSETVEDYAMHLEGRIDAFSRVQSALTRNPTEGVSLLELVAEELIAASAREGEDFVIDGPEIWLPPHIAATFGLALHELVTNALKYGSLANSGGQVHASWTIEKTGRCRTLQFEWKESGVANVESPARYGFGSELLSKTLKYQLGAETTLDLSPDGLHCRIDLPLPSK